MMMKFKIWENCKCGYYISDGDNNYLHKDFMLHRSTSYGFNDKYKYGDAPGYYATEAIAKAYLDEYLNRNSIERGQNMIKLSNGVEISEDTVVSALKKAGISVEPKYIFEAGDVAYCEGKVDSYNWRLIVNVNEILQSVDNAGNSVTQRQAEFEKYNYKYVGKLKDLLKNSL